jgi:hypothetical protein
MSEDHRDEQDPADAEATHEAYVAPKMTDLGSFEELTQFSTSGNVDSEGLS